MIKFKLFLKLLYYSFSTKIVGIKSCSECPFRHYAPNLLTTCAFGDIDLSNRAESNKRFPSKCPIQYGCFVHIVKEKKK